MVYGPGPKSFAQSTMKTPCHVQSVKKLSAKQLQPPGENWREDGENTLGDADESRECQETNERTRRVSVCFWAEVCSEHDHHDGDTLGVARVQITLTSDL